MRVVKLLFFLSVCYTCILSCASVAREDQLYTYLTDSSKFILLHPRGIDQAMDMAQYISAEFRDQIYFLNTYVKADENAIEMSFFNELGASIGDLSYRDGAVHFSSTVIPKSVVRSFKPEYILADFQLCFYDPLLLGKSLEDSGLVLEIQDGSRRILSGNKVIIEIIKTENTVRLENYLRGYAYTLEGDFHGNFN
jgi:hypothetical protein